MAWPQHFVPLAVYPAAERAQPNTLPLLCQPLPLAQEIRELGGHWKVNAPVSDIFQAPDRVTVRTHAPDKE